MAVMCASPTVNAPGTVVFLVFFKSYFCIGNSKGIINASVFIGLPEGKTSSEPARRLRLHSMRCQEKVKYFLWLFSVGLAIFPCVLYRLHLAPRCRTVLDLRLELLRLGRSFLRGRRENAATTSRSLQEFPSVLSQEAQLQASPLLDLTTLQKGQHKAPPED